LLQALEELNVENTQLTEQLDHTAADSHVKYSEMEQVITDCQELELEIARNNKLQAAAREEASAFKKQANDLKDQLATAQWALQEAEAEEESLRSKIVSSPDRRKRDLTAKKERLEKDKEECSNLQMQLQDCKTKAMNVQQATKDMQSVLVVLKELQEEFSRYEQLVRQSEETIEKIEANEKKAADILEVTEETERYLHRSEEKIVYQRKQHKMQIEASHDALEMVKSQLLSVEKDRRDGMARVEAGETEVRALEAAIELARVKTQEEIQTMIAEYQETEKLYLARNNKRMTAIGAV
jgi:chromosome segregation ATPase